MVDGSVWLMVVVCGGDSGGVSRVVGGGGCLAVIGETILEFYIYDIILDGFMRLIFFSFQIADIILVC